METRQLTIVCTYIHTAYSKWFLEQLKKKLCLHCWWCIVVGTWWFVLALSDSGTEVSKLPFKCTEEICINIDALFLPACSSVLNIKVNKAKVCSVDLKASPLKLNTIHKKTTSMLSFFKFQLIIIIAADICINLCQIKMVLIMNDAWRRLNNSIKLEKLLAGDVKQPLMWPTDVGIWVMDVVGCRAKLSQMALHQFGLSLTKTTRTKKQQHFDSQTQHRLTTTPLLAC